MIYQSEEPDVEVSKISVGHFLINSMKKYNDLIAMVDAESGEEITYSGLLSETYHWINVFQKAGLRKGDVVGLIMRFHPKWISVIIALLSCGATIYGCRMIYKLAILKELAFVGASFVIVDGEKYSEIDAEIISKVSSVKLVCQLNQLNELLTGALNKNSETFSDESLFDEAAFIFRTSGTTGEPKGIVSTHKNFVTCASVYMHHLQLKPGQVNAAVLGFVHAFPMFLLATFLGAGIKMILLPDYSIKNFFNYTTKYKINRFFSASVISMKHITEEPILSTHDLSSLTTIMVTGTIFPPVILNKVKKKLGVLVLSLYGSTECFCIAGGHGKEVAPIESVGRLLPGVKIRIVDIESGKDLGYNKAGVIYVKSPFMLKSYYQKSSEETFENGWFNTGDIGCYDDSGWLFVLAKVKDAISQNGTTAVYPAEFENLLMKHPDISDVAIVGVPHSEYQEVAKAFVVKKNESLSETEVLEFFDTQAEESFKLLGGIQFVKSLPRIGLGKVLRRELRNYKEES